MIRLLRSGHNISMRDLTRKFLDQKFGTLSRHLPEFTGSAPPGRMCRR